MPMSASTMSGTPVEHVDRLIAVADGDDMNVFVGKRQLDHALNGDAVVGQKEGMGHVTVIGTYAAA